MALRNIFVGLIIGCIALTYGCRDDFDFDYATGDLSFSSDTVNVDTVFNHKMSETYVLKIYNHRNDDVQIPRISLSRGESSFFKINVDGNSGFEFTDVPIRKNDSIFVFVQLVAGEAPAQPLYDDELNIETTNGIQQVKLVSWIEKADFYETPEGQEFLDIGDASWDNSTSKVIYGNLRVTGQFNIHAGTKVYFHDGAGLTVNDGTNFNVNGSLGHEVVFRSDRHSTRYDSLPNQWSKIHLKNSNSSISYAKIIAGDTGLHIENGTLNISNTRIVNNQSYGILADNASVTGGNIVINQSNLAALAIVNGGSYNFTHSTFANYFSFIGTAGPNYSLYLSNENGESSNSLNATFTNSIFYGYAPNGVHFQIDQSAAFIYSFKNNLIRNNNTAILNIAEDIHFVNAVFGEPNFINTDYDRNLLNLGEGSAAIGQGDSTYSTGIYSLDLNGVPRGTFPDLGAYQFVP